MAARLGSLHLVITITAGLLVFGEGATAQNQLEARLAAAVRKIEMACSDDIKKYCNTVTPDEGRLILCIEAHEDKISTQRDYALFEAARNLDRALDRIEQVADICWNDIEKYCSVAGGSRSVWRPSGHRWRRPAKPKLASSSRGDE